MFFFLLVLLVCMYMYIVIKTGGVVGFVGQVEKFFFFLQQLLSSGAGAVCSALADHRMERKGSPSYVLTYRRAVGRLWQQVLWQCYSRLAFDCSTTYIGRTNSNTLVYWSS